MFYTSYFSKMSKFPPNTIPVSIARYSPQWCSGIREYKALAPLPSTLKNYKRTSNTEEYIRDYRTTVLDKLDPHKVATELSDGANGCDVVLLCYETPDKFCHRHLVATWLTAAGYPCIELHL